MKNEFCLSQKSQFYKNIKFLKKAVDKITIKW